VRRRGGRKRALGTRGADGPAARSQPTLEPGLPIGRDDRWPSLPILAIVDDFTRECLALVADSSLPGLRVARELDAVIAIRSCPAMIVLTTAPS
jgi:putative transposase